MEGLVTRLAQGIRLFSEKEKSVNLLGNGF
jgi:hypothetical protein